MRSTRRTLFALGTAHVAAGLLLPFLARDRQAGGLLSYGLGVATVVAIYTWCRAESLERGTVPPGRSALWAALFSPVFVPVYFFRTRPAVSALKLSAQAYGCYVGLYLLLVVAAVLASLGVGR